MARRMWRGKPRISITFIYEANSFSSGQACIKKCTGKTVEAPWIDDDLRNCMGTRNNVKRKAI